MGRLRRLLGMLGTVLTGLFAVLTGLIAVGCSGSAGSAPTPALPADEMVFTVMSAGGLVPPVYDALDSPSVVIYGDGRVLTKMKNTAMTLVPARYDVARIDRAAVSLFVSGARARQVCHGPCTGLFDPGTDFGSPPVTDLAVTTVTVRASNGEAQASAYALDERFDRGLTAKQRAARAALRALIDQAGELAAGSGQVPYSPDHVVVYEVDPRYGDTPATAAWPGPPLAGFLQPTGKHASIACGELVADPAEEVYQAALKNSGARWLVNGATRVLAVNPLPLPDSCP